MHDIPTHYESLRWICPHLAFTNPVGASGACKVTDTKDVVMVIPRRLSKHTEQKTNNALESTNIKTYFLSMTQHFFLGMQHVPHGWLEDFMNFKFQTNQDFYSAGISDPENLYIITYWLFKTNSSPILSIFRFGCFSKIGVLPNQPILIGFSIIFTIHFGGFHPYFWNSTHFSISPPFPLPGRILPVFVSLLRLLPVDTQRTHGPRPNVSGGLWRRKKWMSLSLSNLLMYIFPHGCSHFRWNHLN